MTLYVGDTLPNLTGTCTSSSGTVNGTGATCVAHILRPDGTTLSKAVTVSATGTWSVTWAVGDLNVQDNYQVEIEVTFSPGNIQTFGGGTFYVGPQIA
jgi:hypothetical protein